MRTVSKLEIRPGGYLSPGETLGRPLKTFGAKGPYPFIEQGRTVPASAIEELAPRGDMIRNYTPLRFARA